eukprot:scaffold35851_cov44-Attheya_sp.AAC.2
MLRACRRFHKDRVSVKKFPWSADLLLRGSVFPFFPARGSVFPFFSFHSTWEVAVCRRSDFPLVSSDTEERSVVGNCSVEFVPVSVRGSSPVVGVCGEDNEDDSCVRIVVVVGNPCRDGRLLER